MNTEKNKCAGCLQHIPGKSRWLICALCKDKYDLNCANVSEARFFNTMSTDHKNNWQCQACRCKLPKHTNPNTPIKILLENSELIDPNVTLRRKTVKDNKNLSCNDISLDEITGNTPLNQTMNENETISTRTITEHWEKNAPIMLDQIGTLLDKKLEQIKFSILAEVRDIIHTEINTSLKEFRASLENDLNEKLMTSQSQLQGKIDSLTKKIVDIEEELDNMNNTKKIVLYGLMEGRRETENELISRVSNVFYDIMNININPYIEEIKRIGKQGNRRPLEINLISKRMTTYVMNNATKFKNTGLAIGKFITGSTLEKRNELIRLMKTTKKQGQNAYIKNNQLYINGKIYSKMEPTAESVSANLPQDASTSSHAPLTLTHQQENPTSSTTPNYPSTGERNRTFRS
jgi:hypothetical protein